MSYTLSLLTTVRLYASHTDDVVVKIDENTNQIKGNMKIMQSDASRTYAHLKLLQGAIKRLERHLNDQERDELLGDEKPQGDQDADGTDPPSADIRPESNRTSVASYSSSLQRSLQDLSSIISSSSAMSQLSSLLISGSPELAEMNNSDFGEPPHQEDSLKSGQEVDSTLEDDEKYQAFIKKTLVGLKSDELLTAPILEESSSTLGELDDGYFDHNIDYEYTSEEFIISYDLDSQVATLPAIRARVNLDELQLSPHPSNYLQDSIRPSLPPALHKSQISESAIETMRKPESPAPAIVPVSDPISSVLASFKSSVKDWKGHNPEQSGDLILHDVLLTTRNSKKPNHDSIYYVYLFERILLFCKTSGPTVKKGVWRSKNSDKSSLQILQLRLIGRIFMRNVKACAFLFKGWAIWDPGFLEG